MKKVFTIITILLCAAASGSAQARLFNFAKNYNVSAFGGMHYNLYENAFSYREHGYGGRLYTSQAGVAFGFDFNEVWGARVVTVMGKNAAACNSRQSGDNFYPYNFQSVDVFGDAIINLKGIDGNLGNFAPKVYAGLGIGHGFDITKGDDSDAEGDVIHPWQEAYLTDPNTCFGLRCGVILEYDFVGGTGLFLDLGAEAYTDKYNGLKPFDSENPSRGKAGFPFDLKFNASFGVIHHFKF